MRERLKNFAKSIWKPIMVWLLASVVVFVVCLAIAKIFDDVQNAASMCAVLDIAIAVFGIPFYLSFRAIRELTNGILQKISCCAWGFFLIPVVAVLFIFPMSTISEDAATGAAKILFIFMSFAFVFGTFAYLIYKLTKGKVRIILEVVLSYFLVTTIISYSGGDGIVDASNKFVSLIITCALIVLIARILVSKLSALGWSPKKSIKTCATVNSPRNATIGYDERRHLATLKGVHIHGLVMNEGVRLSIQLYDDRISFCHWNQEMDSFDKADIISAASHSEQEVIGTTTTARQSTGLASTVAMLSGDWAAAYFFRPKAVTCETKNKTVNYWYFILDTTYGEVAIAVKSKYKLFNFVDQCNDMLSQPDIEYEDEDGTDIQVDVDKMTGSEFEEFCAELLRAKGYDDVRIMGGSGDHGIDIIAVKDEITWGFQCKRWGLESHIGNEVIRDTFAGKAFYHCDIAVVITTTTFTHKAEEYAKETGILLWDRDKLDRQLQDLHQLHPEQKTAGQSDG